MVTKDAKTRPTSAAEKLAARVRGEEIPDEMALPTPSGQQHLDRMQARTGPTKPAGMSTGAWYASQFNARGGQPADEPEPDVEEEPEERLPAWAQKELRKAQNFRTVIAEATAKATGGGPDAA